jgi:DNA polymerase (family 10)
MKLVQAQRLAQKITSELLPFCQKIEIAGSVRRERAEVHDLDLVLIPKNGLSPIIARMMRKCSPVTGGRLFDSRTLTYKMAHGFQIDLFVAHAEIVDLVSTTPSNWGAVYLCRTGSVQHNVQLCSRAHAKGLKFAPYRGIIDGAQVIAGSTEEEIYSALGLVWRAPSARETLT